MMGKFIYVFSEEARDKLLSCGHKMLGSNDPDGVFVFARSDNMVFDLDDISYIESDTLSF